MANGPDLQTRDRQQPERRQPEKRNLPTISGLREVFGSDLEDRSDREVAEMIRQVEAPDAPFEDIAPDVGYDPEAPTAEYSPKAQREFQQTRQERKEEMSPFTRGLRSGLHQMAGSAYGLLGLGADVAEDVTGAGEGVRDWALEGYRGQMREAEKYPTKSLKDVWEDPSLSGLASWAAGVAGEQAPIMASAIASGGAGGVAAGGARTLARKAGTELIEEGVERLGRRQLAKGVAGQIDDQALEAAKRRAAQSIGQSAGFAGSAAGMEAGHMYADAVREVGADEANPLKAGVTGLAAGALELAGGNIRIMRRIFGEQTDDMMQSIIKQARKPESRGAAMNALGEVLREGARQAPAEMGQEAAQEALAIANINWQDPEVQEVLSDENVWQLAEGAAAGGLMGMLGGPIGVGASAATGKRGAQTPEAAEQDLQTRIQNQRNIIQQAGGEQAAEEVAPGIAKNLQQNLQQLQELQQAREEGRQAEEAIIQQQREEAGQAEAPEMAPPQEGAPQQAGVQEPGPPPQGGTEFTTRDAYGGRGTEETEAIAQGRYRVDVRQADLAALSEVVEDPESLRPLRNQVEQIQREVDTDVGRREQQLGRRPQQDRYTRDRRQSGLRQELENTNQALRELNEAERGTEPWEKRARARGRNIESQYGVSLEPNQVEQFYRRRAEELKQQLSDQQLQQFRENVRQRTGQEPVVSLERETGTRPFPEEEAAPGAEAQQTTAEAGPELTVRDQQDVERIARRQVDLSQVETDELSAISGQLQARLNREQDDQRATSTAMALSRVNQEMSRREGRGERPGEVTVAQRPTEEIGEQAAPQRRTVTVEQTQLPDDLRETAERMNLRTRQEGTEAELRDITLAEDGTLRAQHEASTEERDARRAAFAEGQAEGATGGGQRRRAAQPTTRSYQADQDTSELPTGEDAGVGAVENMESTQEAVESPSTTQAGEVVVTAEGLDRIIRPTGRETATAQDIEQASRGYEEAGATEVRDSEGQGRPAEREDQEVRAARRSDSETLAEDQRTPGTTLVPPVTIRDSTETIRDAERRANHALEGVRALREATNHQRRREALMNYFDYTESSLKPEPGSELTAAQKSKELRDEFLHHEEGLQRDLELIQELAAEKERTDRTLSAREQAVQDYTNEDGTLDVEGAMAEANQIRQSALIHSEMQQAGLNDPVAMRTFLVKKLDYRPRDLEVAPGARRSADQKVLDLAQREVERLGQIRERWNGLYFDIYQNQGLKNAADGTTWGFAGRFNQRRLRQRRERLEDQSEEREFNDPQGEMNPENRNSIPASLYEFFKQNNLRFSRDNDGNPAITKTQKGPGDYADFNAAVQHLYTEGYIDGMTHGYIRGLPWIVPYKWVAKQRMNGGREEPFWNNPEYMGISKETQEALAEGQRRIREEENLRDRFQRARMQQIAQEPESRAPLYPSGERPEVETLSFGDAQQLVDAYEQFNREVSEAGDRIGRESLDELEKLYAMVELSRADREQLRTATNAERHAIYERNSAELYRPTNYATARSLLKQIFYAMGVSRQLPVDPQTITTQRNNLQQGQYVRKRDGQFYKILQRRNDETGFIVERLFTDAETPPRSSINDGDLVQWVPRLNDYLKQNMFDTYHTALFNEYMRRREEKIRNRRIRDGNLPPIPAYLVRDPETDTYILRAFPREDSIHYQEYSVDPETSQQDPMGLRRMARQIGATLNVADRREELADEGEVGRDADPRGQPHVLGSDDLATDGGIRIFEVGQNWGVEQKTSQKNLKGTPEAPQDVGDIYDENGDPRPEVIAHLQRMNKYRQEHFGTTMFESSVDAWMKRVDKGLYYNVESIPVPERKQLIEQGYGSHLKPDQEGQPARRGANGFEDYSADQFNLTEEFQRELELVEEAVQNGKLTTYGLIPQADGTPRVWAKKYRNDDRRSQVLYNLSLYPMREEGPEGIYAEGIEEMPYENRDNEITEGDLAQLKEFAPHTVLREDTIAQTDSRSRQVTLRLGDRTATYGVIDSNLPSLARTLEEENNLNERLRKAEENGAWILSRPINNLFGNIVSHVNQLPDPAQSQATIKDGYDRIRRMQRRLKAGRRAETIIVDNFSELPLAVQNELGQSGLAMRAKGVKRDNTIYLIRNRHHDNSDLQRSFIHEHVGHFGLRETLGSDEAFTAYLDSVVNKFPDRVQAVQDSRNLDSTMEGRRRAAEEVIAEMLADANIDEQGQVQPREAATLLDRVVAFVQRALRKVGIMDDINYTRAEIRDLAGRAFKGLDIKKSIGFGKTFTDLVHGGNIRNLDHYRHYEPTFKDRVARYFQDNFRAIMQLQQGHRNEGYRITEETDLYGKLGQVSSVTQKQIAKVDEEHVRPLIDGLKNNGITNQELDQYIQDGTVPQGLSESTMRGLREQLTAIEQKWDQLLDDYDLRATPVPNMDRETQEEGYGPTINTISSVYTTIASGEKNSVKKAFMNLVREIQQDRPGDDMFTVTEVRKHADGSFNVDPEEWPNYVNVRSGKRRYLVDVHHQYLRDALQKMNPEPSKQVIQFAHRANRLMANALIKFNPQFWVTNFTRDAVTGLIHLKAAEKEMGSEGMARNAGRNLFSAMRGMNRYLKGKDTEWRNMIERFQEAGGQMGYSTLAEARDFEGKAKELERLLHQSDSTMNTLYSHWSKFEQVIDRFNKVMENSTRLAAFNEAVTNQGWEDYDAGRMAKELTINFDRHGNSDWMRGLYLFFNAGIQGPMATAKWLSRDPQRGKRILVATAVGGLILSEMARAGLGEDDDTGEERYDLIPDFVKEHSFIIPMPALHEDGYITVPKPYGFGGIADIGRFVSDNLHGRDPSAATMALIGSLGRNFNPISGEYEIDSTKDVPNKAWQMAMPTVLEPPSEAFIQNESWTGIPVRTDEEASLAQNMVTNARHMMQRYAGGTGKFIETLFTDMSAAVNERMDELNKHELLTRRFYGGIPDHTSERLFYQTTADLKRIRSRLHDMRAKLNNTYDPDLYASRQQEIDEYEQENYAELNWLRDRMMDTESRTSEYRGLIEAASDQETKDEYRNQMIEEMRDFLHAYNSHVEGGET